MDGPVANGEKKILSLVKLLFRKREIGRTPGGNQVVDNLWMLI